MVRLTVRDMWYIMWPRKGFGSADCDTIYAIYLSLFTQSANPNPFRGTHCNISTNFLQQIFVLVQVLGSPEYLPEVRLPVDKRPIVLCHEPQKGDFFLSLISEYKLPFNAALWRTLYSLEDWSTDIRYSYIFESQVAFARKQLNLKPWRMEGRGPWYIIDVYI